MPFSTTTNPRLMPRAPLQLARNMMAGTQALSEEWHCKIIGEAAKDKRDRSQRVRGGQECLGATLLVQNPLRRRYIPAPLYTEPLPW